ncbi:MAG: hypothetical protein VYE68_15870 [Acidobacteriota bacterium]|nr:hypothetical protein [Acidobacteriota bacterium]
MRSLVLFWSDLLLLLVVVLAGCSAPRLELPEGPGVPFPEYAALFETVASECRGVKSLDAVIRLGGRGGGTRLRGRVLAGMAAPGLVRLEGVAPFGAPFFFLVGSPDTATLWLTREGRVVRDVPVADLVAALTGVAWGADDLRAVLTGCVVPDPQPIQGRQYGEWVAVDLAAEVVAFLRPVDGVPRLVAATRHELTIEYAEFRLGLPRQVRVVSSETIGGQPTTDFTARLSNLSLNVDLGPEVFSLSVPSDVELVTLDQLRGSGPLAVPDGPESSQGFP